MVGESRRYPGEGEKMNGIQSFNPRAHKRMVLAGTFLAAIVLSIIPIPNWAEPFRPDWVALVLIYWCMASPDRVGVGTGWLTGLIMDVLYGSLLGQHALANTILAFLVLKIHLQVRMFPRWQQGVTVFILVGVNHLLVLWIKGATGQAPSTWAYWLPSVVSALIWPWLFILLRDLRRRANIN